jgi:undecaprenyl-diphosphatase
MAQIVPPPEEVKVSRFRAFVRRLKAIYFIVGLFLVLIALSVVVHSLGVLDVDVAVTHAVQTVRTPFLDAFANFLSFMGEIGVLIAASVLTALFFWYLKLPKSSAITLVSLLSYPLNVEMKGLVDRLRPASTLVKVISPAGGFSFPSGHAMIAGTVYGCIAYLLWTQIKSPARWLIPTVTGVFIFLIGLSRIYLGVHWFSDVMGGWIAATILVLILAQMHRTWVKPLIAPTATTTP